eukprot:GILJ01025938.1.p1 GENE.GILJ01025938.1~~GILJ01025938.1.p1  ORF type:complete len:355 (-),score=53.76 GILJ01025938.1:88-1056(-)
MMAKFGAIASGKINLLHKGPADDDDTKLQLEEIAMHERSKTSHNQLDKLQGLQKQLDDLLKQEKEAKDTSIPLLPIKEKEEPVDANPSIELPVNHAPSITMPIELPIPATPVPPKPKGPFETIRTGWMLVSSNHTDFNLRGEESLKPLYLNLNSRVLSFFRAKGSVQTAQGIIKVNRIAFPIDNVPCPHSDLFCLQVASSYEKWYLCSRDSETLQQWGQELHTLGGVKDFELRKMQSPVVTQLQGYRVTTTEPVGPPSSRAAMVDSTFQRTEDVIKSFKDILIRSKLPMSDHHLHTLSKMLVMDNLQAEGVKLDQVDRHSEG